MLLGVFCYTKAYILLPGNVMISTVENVYADEEDRI